ncbi:MAG TPA: penicillin acylase family protein [Thermoleophilaceae bacterium]
MKRLALLLACFCTLALPGVAAAKDFASTALNIVPSGEWGDVPIPNGATSQALMYDGLTPLFDHVTTSDLFKYFKSERLTDNGQGHLRTENPRKGLRIVRDKFNVPHIYAKTDDLLTWGTGWVLGEDRHLLLDEARGDARIAALDVPGVDAFALVKQLKTFTPSAQAEAIVSRQTDALKHDGPKGRAVLRNVDLFVQGVNAWYRHNGTPANPPFDRADIYATNAVAGQLFGRGGGGEVASSNLLGSLQQRLGASQGTLLWNDLRERNDPEADTTVDGRFPYDPTPKVLGAGNVVLDPGSFQATPEPGVTASEALSTRPAHASNFLLVSSKRSTNHHPLFVGGPQIGYYYPGLTLEEDLHAPGIQARGVASPGSPGDLLIGRAQDYAWTLTSAGSDVIDDYVETLCGGSDTKYMYKGKCRDMGFVNAGTIAGQTQPLTYHTTVHGPVLGYATVKGTLVAVSQKRSSYGKDILWQVPFTDLTKGRVHGVKSFFKVMEESPFTFNTGYADDRHIADYSTGFYPLRPKGVDGDLPTNGNGNFEWHGFAPPRLHPQGVDSKSGVLVNWNNKPGPDFPSADNQFGFGPLWRSQMLSAGLAKHKKLDLAQVVSAMNGAATTDFRDVFLMPVVAKVMQKVSAPNARDAQLLNMLMSWRSKGGSVLDRNKDGKVDDPGAAIMDAFGPLLADAVMDPVLGPQAPLLQRIIPDSSGTGGGFANSQASYVDKDLRTLLGDKVKGKFHFHFCGNGNVTACANSLWAALDSAGNQVAAAQGPDPSAWHADADAEKITFLPGILPLKISYTNRPTGIQQVISFKGHRK